MILANVAVYVWMGRQTGHFDRFGESDLLRYGASVAPLAASGNYGQLFTSLFVHADLQHLIQNMVALLLVGGTLERFLGRGKWLAVYLLGGVFAAFASACLNFDTVHTTLFGQVQRVIVIGMGASGAIMALSGVEIAIGLGLLRRPPQERPSKVDMGGAFLFPLLTLLYGMFTPHVDNAAHIAGFLFGLTVGLPFTLPGQLSRAAAAGLAAMLALVLAGVAWQLDAGVRANPDAGEIHAIALHRQHELERVRMLRERIAQERNDAWGLVSSQQARGNVIPVSFVGRVIPSRDPQRVFLLRNYDDAEIIEYDLERNAALRTVLRRAYGKNELWGCPRAQCHAVGVADLQLDEASGKAYAANLVKGAVSRIDLATGRIDFSVATGPFPSRLLMHQGTLYAFDTVANTLSQIDASQGTLQRRVQLPGDGDSGYRWPSGDTMAFGRGGDWLYVRPADGRVLRVRPADGQVEPVSDGPVRRMGTDGRGRVWLLDRDGLQYPDEGGPRARIAYQLDLRQRRRVPGMLVDTGEGLPLILHGHDGVLLGSSAHTGQLLRLYPLVENPDDILVMAQLDRDRFYVAGRRQVQILRADAALSALQAGKEYQKMLEQQPQWKHALELQPLARTASD